MIRRYFLSLVAVAGFALAAAADDKPKRVLFVTHSGGFIHDSVGVAEDVLTELGSKNAFTVTTWRYTGDPADPGFAKYSTDFQNRARKPVDKEHMGRINKDTLKNFDCVFFLTTGSGPQKKNIGPLTPDELKDLTAWVQAGGCLIGSHCAADTLYDTSYGELIGAFFKTHPSGLQKIKLKCEDPKHPAAAGFTDGQDYEDEIYIFQDATADRSKIHVIWSVEKGQFDKYAGKGARKDADYLISWCKDDGKGKVFYTSLGHQQKVWKDEKFQKHLLGGMNWAMGRAEGSAAPSAGLSEKK
jgi:type 1 glutamine amidotransferase